MKTLAELSEYIGKHYLGCTETEHKENLLAAIVDLQGIEDEENRPVLNKLYRAKKTLLVDALRKRMGL